MLDKNKLKSTFIMSSILQLLCQTSRSFFLLSLLIIGLTACSRRYHDVPAYMAFDFGEHENRGVGRFKSSLLAEQMAEYYRGSQPGPIGVATFVNVDDLHASSTFGRIFAEQIISELSMQGFDVVELRHSDVLQFLDTTGEFALTRDVAALKPERELGGIVVGTYAVSPVRVYVNARLVEPSTSHVLAVGSVEMGKTNEIARLLRGGSVGATLERIPVKHLGFNSMPMAMNPYWQQAQNWQMEERMGMAQRANPQAGNQNPNTMPNQNMPSSFNMAAKPSIPEAIEQKTELDSQVIELKEVEPQVEGKTSLDAEVRAEDIK